MNKSLVMRTLCLKTILPAAAALVFAATGGSALAVTPTQQDAATQIELKLTSAFIPTLKTPTTVSKAKAADLITALSLALQDPANSAFPADIMATGAFLAESGKTRADKDKVAAQVIATVAAARNLSNDAAGLGAVTAAVFSVNANDTKNHLTAAGQAAAIIGGIKTAGSASVGETVGVDVANALGSTDLATLLGNTVKGLGKTTTLAQGAVLTNFVKGVLETKLSSGTTSFVEPIADKVAATNPVGTGALFGGLVLANVGGNFTTDAQIQGLISAVIQDAKLTKSLGEIVADTTGSVTDRGALTTALAASTIKGKAIPDTTKALLTQGLLRTATSSTEVNTILTNAGTLDPTKYGATLITGAGANAQAVAAKLSNTAPSDVKKQEALGIALINALALSSPAAAEGAADGIFTNSIFSSQSAKQQFGVDTVAKLKSFAAAGYVAAAIVGGTQSSGEAITATAALMTKGTKAATDIAEQVAALAVSGADKSVFADGLAGQVPKLSQNVAVGVSLADPTDAGPITAKAIAHGGLPDKATLGKAATIAAAVANVVDEEQTSEIAQSVTALMSTTAVAGSSTPVKLSLVGTLATGLAKAIQTKPGVTNANRMDELGELAATLTAGVLGKSGADTKGQTAEQKLITTIGSDILKALNKVPALSGDPHPGNTNFSVSAELVTNTQTSKADLWEARDIAGSIAQTIENASLTAITQGQKDALLGTPTGTSGHTVGILEKAFVKLAGTKTSGTVAAVIEAIDEVLHGTSGIKFEVGPDVDKETDNRNG